MHSEFRERDQCNVHEHVAFRKLKSQTVWRIWCFVWYVSFGLFSSFHSSRLRSSSSSYSSCWCCCWCCCWWWCYVCCFFCSFLYLKRAFDAVSCSNVRISECITAARCLYNKRKILGKNLPLTTCIHLSRICCVSFIVYHTYLVISFHSFFFLLSLLSLYFALFILSGISFLALVSTISELIVCTYSLLCPWVASVIFEHTQETERRQREREKRRNYLKWNFLPFQERILFIEMAECITWFYDIWSIQNHNIISSVCPSLSIHLYSIPLFSMELTITNRVNQFEDQCHSVEKVTKIPTLSLSLVFFCCLFGCNNVFPVENCKYRYREFVCLTFD